MYIVAYNVNSNFVLKIQLIFFWCHVLFFEGCLQYHMHKGDTKVTFETCGAIGEKAQVSLVWIKILNVENASHSQRLRVVRMKLQG